MKFYLSCIQKLSELVQETSGTENRFLACPSLRVYESTDFDFLTASVPKPEHFISSENISMQFNSLSNSDTYWDVDATSSLYELYKEQLERLRLKAREDISKQNEDAEKLLHNPDGSPSTILINYTESLNEYENILDEHSSFLDNINPEASDQEQLVFNRKWDVLQKQLSLFVAKWKLNASKEEIERSLEQLNTLTDFDAFLALKNTIENKLKEGEVTGIRSLSEYSKINIFPSDFNNNDLAWSTMEITHSEVDKIFKRAQNTLKGFNEDILTFEYDESFIEKISVNYCIITIKRSWLHKTIFESEFVELGYEREKYTYAKKVILLKDLRVILKEDLTPSEKAEIDGNSIIKFGPMFMKNQLFTNAISAKQFIKPITSKAIYKKAYASKMDKKIALVSPKLVLSNKKSIPIIKTKEVKPVAVLKPQKNRVNSKLLKVNALKSIVNRKKTKINPISKEVISTFKKANLKSVMIYNIAKEPNSKESRVHFKVEDHLGNHPLYKVEISIKDQRSSNFKEVETAGDGQISILLTESNYEITLRKNGFKEITFIQSIKKDANITILKKLEPQEVVYDSYFLVGIIGDHISL